MCEFTQTELLFPDEEYGYEDGAEGEEGYYDEYQSAASSKRKGGNLGGGGYKLDGFVVDEEESDEDWRPPPLDGFGAYKRRKRPKSEGSSSGGGSGEEEDDFKDEFVKPAKVYKVRTNGKRCLNTHGFHTRMFLISERQPPWPEEDHPWLAEEMLRVRS